MSGDRARSGPESKELGRAAAGPERAAGGPARECPLGFPDPTPIAASNRGNEAPICGEVVGGFESAGALAPVGVVPGERRCRWRG